MNMIDKKEKYISTYNQLGVVFLEAYKCSSILETVENLYANEQECLHEGPYVGIMAFFVELTKKDFVMDICKIGGESSKFAKAISLQMLEIISDEMIKSGVIERSPQVTISEELLKSQNKARKFRDKYIAHLDYTRELDKLNISELRALLNRYKEIYDGFAYDGFDGISKLSKEVVESTKAKYSISLGILLSKLEL